MKILFCLTILCEFFNAIASNGIVFDDMSPQEKRSFFGTEDGSIPEYEIVELVLPSRSKRSSGGPVKITFNAFGDRLTSTLHVVDGYDLLNPSLTGVWSAIRNPNAFQGIEYMPWPEMLSSIGEITFYRSLHDVSAVTRCTQSDGDEIILGVLENNYIVKSVPTKFIYDSINIHRKHFIKVRSVNSPEDENDKRLLVAIFKNQKSPEHYVHHHARRGIFSEDGLHRTRRQSKPSTAVPDVVYPKLLIIPDSSVLNAYGDHRLMLKELIARIHCVNAVFGRLKNPAVHLTITGIIIPSDDAVLPFMGNKTGFDNRVDGHEIIDAAEEHFSREKHRFPRHEWDTMVLFTMNRMKVSGQEPDEPVNIEGISHFRSGCKSTASVVTLTGIMDSVHTVAHELGHTFGVGDHDDDQKPHSSCKNVTGYVMTNNNDDVKLLDWSDCSRVALQEYFRSEEAKCTYFHPNIVANNKRTLDGSWLSLDAQCDNHYDGTDGFCMIPKLDPGSCSKVGCKKNGTCDLHFRPLEGSLLHDDKRGDKICLDGIWKLNNTVR